MWSSRPFIPPAPFICGERAGLEFWFTLATLAGRSDSSTRQPALFAKSGFACAAAGAGAGSTERDLGQDLAEDPVALGPDALGPLLVAGLQHQGGATHGLTTPRRDAYAAGSRVVLGDGHLDHAEALELPHELTAPLGRHLRAVGQFADRQPVRRQPLQHPQLG